MFVFTSFKLYFSLVPNGFLIRTIAFDIFTAFISADYNSNQKPQGISESVWVGRKDP